MTRHNYGTYVINSLAYFLLNPRVHSSTQLFIRTYTYIRIYFKLIKPSPHPSLHQFNTLFIILCLHIYHSSVYRSINPPIDLNISPIHAPVHPFFYLTYSTTRIHTSFHPKRHPSTTLTQAPIHQHIHQSIVIRYSRCNRCSSKCDRHCRVREACASLRLNMNMSTEYVIHSIYLHIIWLNRVNSR